MAVSLYGTQTLTTVQQRIADTPDGFWRRLFPRLLTSDREEIMFEVLDTETRKLAPFVAPNVQGRVMRGKGFGVRTFRPAYVKPKHVVDPMKAIPRMFGEAIGGALSLQQRFDAHVANNLRDERIVIERRWEWMCARAIIDGEVTISGQDYPTVTVDFLRHDDLTVTLSGTALWSATATRDPLGDLQSMVSAAFTHGSAPTPNLVFGTDAWNAFISDTDVLDLLDSTRRGSTSNFSRTGLNEEGNFQDMGEVSGPGGRFQLWRYSNWYTDVNEETGEETVAQFLDPRDVVGFGSAVDGIACFGAIMDNKAFGRQEATMFPKMWDSEDPPAVFTMTQSAPLFVPGNPNNTWRLRVLA